MKSSILSFLIIFLFASCKGTTAETSSNTDKSSIYIKNKNKKSLGKSQGFASPSCLSSDEEKKWDFPGFKDDSVLLPSLNTDPVSNEDIISAIKAGFHEIPKRKQWFKAYTTARAVRIFYSPSVKSLELGRTEVHKSFPAAGYVKATPDCRAGWLRLGIHAYICLNHLQPTRKPPELRVLPVLKSKKSLTPGKYAYIRLSGTEWYRSRQDVKNRKPAGKLPGGFYIHFKRFTRINGHNYWKTVKNRYIPIENIAAHHPSKHMGVELNENMKLPLAFPISKNRNGKGRKIDVYDRPAGKVIDKIPYHKPVRIYGKKGVRYKGVYYRIGKCRWIASKDVAAAFPAKLPPGVHEGEYWIDINLGRQTLVLYHNKTPVFATIISSGKNEHPTKHGVFRIYWKVAEIDMKNEVGADEQYLASSVPWAMFFWKGQALHAAYWHDDFGRKKSHGCINLAPRDAKYIYEHVKPVNGAEWRYRWGGKNFPGTVVQIRRKDKDKPMVFGYARKFIPEDIMKKLDEDWKKRLEEESLKITGAKTGDKKSDK